MVSIPTEPALQLNEGCAYRELLGPDAEGRTVLDYLERRYSHSSRTVWAERISSGHVFVDSRPVGQEQVLRRGSELLWQRPPWIEPDAPTSLPILFEDEDLLALAKPAGLPTLPGANFLQTTLLYLARAHAPDAAPVHRLGRWTSGIVLCTRNASARAKLTEQWSTPAVEKRYRALASGSPAFDTITIDASIGPVPHALLGSIHAATQEGKPALSRVTVRERRENSFATSI